MKNKTKIVVLFITLVLGFFIGRCTTNVSDDTITSVELSQAKQNAIDSTKTADARIRLSEKDSLIKKYEVRLTNTIIGTNHVAYENKLLKVEVDTLKQYYLSHHTLSNCDSVVHKQDKYIFGLSVERDSLKNGYNTCSFINTELSSKVPIYENLLKEKQKTIDLANTNITILEKRVYKAPLFTPFINASWNSFGYVGAGGGIYYHNVGVGAKYITNFKNKGFEINTQIKF